jgi:hypothetical protein
MQPRRGNNLAAGRLWRSALCGAVLALGASAAAAEGSADGWVPLRGVAAPLLGAWIAASKRDAIAHGVERIPRGIARALRGYVPQHALDAVRWCSGGCGSALSLQSASFRSGLTPAITLEDVIVFADREAALEDPALWVHELKHVEQFRVWGVDGFARRYLEDYEAVEAPAAEYRWQWMKLTGRVPKPASGGEP